MPAELEYTIDELARAAGMTVRSVRVYHERGLLPSPDVRGRIGYYGADHLDRLRVISRLLDRGIKLSGIRELLAAWHRGDDLADVLGVAGRAATAAAPQTNGAPGEGPPTDLAGAITPRCGDLAECLIDAGLPPATVLRLVDRLAYDCEEIADRYNAQLARRGPTTAEPSAAVPDLKEHMLAAVEELVQHSLNRHRSDPPK